MDVLILGGTAWLGREIARQAVAHGHAVTCLARGESGDVGIQTRVLRFPNVVGERARHWTYVSSVSAYAPRATSSTDEGGELLPATDLDTVDRERYGAAKVACENAS